MDSQETPAIILYVYGLLVAGYVGAIILALRIRSKRRKARIQAWRGGEAYARSPLGLGNSSTGGSAV